MKTVLLFSIIFCAIALPALGDLMDTDLNKIRLVIQEEVKKEVESAETRIKEYIDLKINGIDKQFEGVNNQITHVQYATYVVIALIVVAVGITQIVMAWHSRTERIESVCELRNVSRNGFISTHPASFDRFELMFSF